MSTNKSPNADTIALERVSKSLGKRQVLKDVSFAVQKGDIFGYLGPNGAGKTTTIRILLGLLRPTSGKATIIGEQANRDRTRSKLGFVLEADGLYDNMTARENLEYFARIYGLDRTADRIDRALKLANLSDRAGDRVGAYSKGMRQRLALGRALLHDPAVLVLDEPTAGVDPSGQMEVRQIMLDMSHREGKTILLSSHNLDEVQRICNRIALINRGQIRLYGDRDSLQREMGKGKVIIETSDALPTPLVAEVRGLSGVAVESASDRTLVLSLGKGRDTPDIVAFLVGKGVRIEQAKRADASLEDIYSRILRETEAL